MNEAVFPSFPPGEILLDEVFQPGTAEEVVQAPPGGDVADDQNPLPVPAQRQVGQEPANAGGGLPPAFPARIGPVQVLTPAGVQLGRRHPIALPVVALAQPPIMQNGDRRTCEGNRRVWAARARSELNTAVI
jgi:hypothetical protein